MSDAPEVFYFPPGPPTMRVYTVTEPIVIGQAHLRAGATITYDRTMNVFTIRGALEFDPWETAPVGAVSE